jgi:hypothetical protein
LTHEIFNVTCLRTQSCGQRHCHGDTQLAYTSLI